MDEKFAKFQNNINAMRLKVIKAKGESVKGLSEQVVVKKNSLTKKQTNTQEKD